MGSASGTPTGVPRQTAMSSSSRKVQRSRRGVPCRKERLVVDSRLRASTFEGDSSSTEAREAEWQGP